MRGSRPIDRFFLPVLLSKNLKSRPVSIDIGTSEVPERIVLFRNSKGEVVATQDRCPHRGAPLSLGKIENDEIVCPYHGWRIDRDGGTTHPVSGLVKNCKVPTYSAHEAEGFVWIASSPLARRSSFSQDKEWTYLGAYEISVSAPLELVLDNFGEDEHFPYVHKVLGWDQRGAKEVQFNYEVRGSEIDVNYRGPQRKFFGQSLFLLKPGSYFDNRWTVSFQPVKAVYTVRSTDRDGIPISPLKQRAVIHFVPHGERKTVIRVAQYASLGSPRWSFFLRMMSPLTLWLSKWDLEHDKHFLEKFVEIAPEPGPTRYGKYDQPLFHARRLLGELYWKRAEASSAISRLEKGLESSSSEPTLNA